MKKILIIFTLCLLIVVSCFSQKKLIIAGDTLIALTPLELKKANVLFVERTMYKEYADSLFKMNLEKDSHILSLRKLNSLKTEKNGLLEKNLALIDSTTKTKDARIKILNSQIKSEQKKKVKSFFMGTGTGLVLSSILYLIFGK